MIGIGLLFFIFRQGAVKEIPVAVVDRDNSTLSVKIANAINASTDAEIVLRTPNIFEAKEMLEKGVIDAIILIPGETEKLVFQGVEAPIPFYINGTNVLKAGLIQRSVLTSIKTVSGGVQLKKLLMSEKKEQQAMSRVVPINVQKHILFNPFTNYAYFLNSAMLFIILFLFVFLGSIYSLGNELKHGTGASLLDAGNKSVRLAVVGKMIPYTIIFSGIATFINFLLYHIEGMPLNGSFWLIFIGQFITIITYQFMGLIFIGATINLRLAMSLGSAYSMMGITFSGITFPLEAMPKVAQIFACVFPFTWWEKLFISQSLRGAPTKEALIYICYIMVFMLVSICFLPIYKKYLGDEKYWGKK